MSLRAVIFCTLLLASAVLAEEWVLTPNGERPLSCVHHIDSALEHAVHHADGSLSIMRLKPETNEYFVKEHHEPCPHALRNATAQTALPNGWAAYTVWQAGIVMDSYGGIWSVPPTPSVKAVQTLFLFTGFQNSFFAANAAGVSIIQPVLQWGTSAAGGGQYWAIASWFVGGAHTVYSDLKQVSTGDTIVGNMTLNASTQKWAIVTNDTTSGVTTSISVSTQVTEIDAFVTLEVYGVTACGDYPNGSDTFSDLFITASGKQVTPRWVAQTEPGCNESVKIVSPSTIIINF